MSACTLQKMQADIIIIDFAPTLNFFILVPKAGTACRSFQIEAMLFH